MSTSHPGYLPPELGSADEGKTNVGKKGGSTSHEKKVTKVTRGEEENDLNVEDGSNSSECSDSDTFNRADENSGDEPSSDGVEELGSESQSMLELELVSGKKAPSARKPSKKAIETALSEVSQASYVTAETALLTCRWKRAVFLEESEPEAMAPSRTPKYTTGHGLGIKVKLEKTDADSDDEDDDDDNGDNDRSDEKSRAKRVYKHALKILKLKLYFEDFFPSDDNRASLVYDCWMAGAKVTKGLDEDHETLDWMLHNFEFNKKVRDELIFSYPRIHYQ